MAWRGCRRIEMKRIVAIIIAVCMLLGLIFTISARVKQQKEMPILRDATLYAVKTDGVPVFKDDAEELWEIQWLTEATAQDSVLLEITDGKITRTWIEVVQGSGDGEIE